MLVMALVLSSHSMVSDQVIRTALRITVLDNLGSKVTGASVILYNNEEDYRNSEHPVLEAQITDNKGRVTFRGLEEKVYFVDVQMGDLNNVGLAVQTDTLQPNLINKVNIVIE